MFGSRRFLIAALALAAAAAWAAPVTVKVASVAPRSSPWGVALDKLSAQWSELSGGEVELVVYHDGQAGNETEAIAKMRLNQLQGAVLSSAGLAAISPDVLSLSIPFLIKDDAEFSRALKAARPMLDERFVQKGFTVLSWSKLGWLRFFTRKPVRTPADLQALQTAGGNENEALGNAFRQLGYRMVPVSMPDLMASLDGGLVDAFYSSPAGALGYGWYQAAPYMLDLKFSPFVGAFLLRSSAWSRIPEKYRDTLATVSRRMGFELDKAAADLDKAALETMKEDGLAVVVPTDSEAAYWKADMEAGVERTLGAGFPRESYEELKKLLKGGGTK